MHHHGHGQKNHYSVQSCGYRSVSASSFYIMPCDRVCTLTLSFATSHCPPSPVLGWEQRHLVAKSQSSLEQRACAFQQSGQYVHDFLNWVKEPKEEDIPEYRLTTQYLRVTSYLSCFLASINLNMSWDMPMKCEQKHSVFSLHGNFYKMVRLLLQSLPISSVQQKLFLGGICYHLH